MNIKSTVNVKLQEKNGALFFNLALIISIFTIALVALPQTLFFVVAIIVLIALRMIEKEVEKKDTHGSSMLTNI